MGRCWPQLVRIPTKPFFDQVNTPLLTHNTAADESLKFWKIFEKKPGASGSIGGAGAVAKAEMSKHMTIR